MSLYYSTSTLIDSSVSTAWPGPNTASEAVEGCLMERFVGLKWFPCWIWLVTPAQGSRSGSWSMPKPTFFMSFLSPPEGLPLQKCSKTHERGGPPWVIPDCLLYSSVFCVNTILYISYVCIYSNNVSHYLQISICRFIYRSQYCCKFECRYVALVDSRGLHTFAVSCTN